MNSRKPFPNIPYSHSRRRVTHEMDLQTSRQDASEMLSTEQPDDDIRYLLFMFGAIKVGYKMLFISPRNNLDGHLNVLEKSNCQIFLSASDSHTDIQPILERRPMLLFYTSGINAAITWALRLSVTLVYGDPLNAAYVAHMHQFAGVNATMGAPSIYEELSSREEWLEGLKRIHYVVASRAPLSHKTGNIITKYSRVIGNLGATETANLPRLAPAPEDWEYFYWHPTHSGIELRPDLDSDSGLHELFILRGGPGLESFPDLREWSMNNLYDRHPTKPFLWRYRERKDDVIALSNGENITPPLMETALASCPRVRGAMIVGQRRFHPTALVELREGVAPPAAHEREELLGLLAPFIEAANKHAPAHARLD